MTVKRAIAALVFIILSCLLFAAVSVEKAETLKLEGTSQYALVLSEDAISLYTCTGKQVDSYGIQSDGEHIISCCTGDIDNDSREEILMVTGIEDTFYGNKLVILSYDQGFKKLYEKTYKEFNPWKVQTADVDGDGTLEISIGVYKESPFHPVMAKRPFIFNWYKGDLVPKWRGSRLSRPFEDYIFADVDKDGLEEIVANEVLPDGKKCISAYKWRGFGFENMAESGAYEDIEQIKRPSGTENSIGAKVKRDNRTGWVKFIYTDNKLTEAGRPEK